ncbi:MAG: hypothetical protein U0Q03_20540 [Acidimicrobiales bacterium]
MALVVFAADPKRLGALDVALGPCVPKPGRCKALVSPLNQDLGETVEQASALFTALTGEPAGAVLEVDSENGTGVLHRCTDVFLNAMADRSELLLAMTDLDVLDRELDRLSDAWMRAATWPPQYVSVKNRLQRIHLARVARSKGQTVYFWFGPSVEMRGVVAGSGPYPTR